jgi:hypothetical protein
MRFQEATAAALILDVLDDRYAFGCECEEPGQKKPHSESSMQIDPGFQ